MSSAADRSRGGHGAGLCVMGVEGRVAREIVRLARDRLGVEAVTTSLRAPGTARPAVLDVDEGPTGGRLQALGGQGADTVVHVAVSTDLALDLRLATPARRAGLVCLTRAAFAATAQGGHLVVVSSAQVYGARADNPLPLPADAPLRAQDDGGLVGDLLAIEAEVADLHAQRPDLRVTILRPAALVGPGIDTTVTRHFEAPRLLVLGGSEPLWQFVHVEDVASAVLTVVTHQPLEELEEVLTVGPAVWLTQSRVERLSGKRRLVLPAMTALSAAKRLQAAGVLSTSGADLDFVRYPWAVSSEALEALGWSARYDNETCLQILLEQIRQDRGLAALRRDAAVGTASAGVALVGTAAMLRRRRRREG